MCQAADSGSLGLLLKDGLENDDTRWQAPRTIDYLGGKIPGGYRVRMASRQPPQGETARAPSRYCNLPLVLELRCNADTLDVHPNGARLVKVVGAHKNDGPRPARWVPATVTKNITVLRCDVSAPDDAEDRWLELSNWPFMFTSPTATSPGLEWAHENSDMVLQNGGYRWMPARR